MRIKTGNRKSSERESIVLDVSFDRSTFSTLETPFGVIVKILDTHPSGELGGPAFPSRVLRVAIPPGMRPSEVRYRVREKTVVMKGPVLLAPLQKARPGVQQDEKKESSKTKETDKSKLRLRATSRLSIEAPLVEPVEGPSFEVPRSDLYAKEVKKPRPTAQLIGSEMIGLTPIALVEISPITLNKKGSLVLATKITVEVMYDTLIKEAKDKAAAPFGSQIVSHAQANRLVNLTRLMVVNPELVLDISEFFPPLVTNIDYLIITDNQRWNAETITSIGATSGDMVGMFARLATWKAKRGLRTRVVTVSQIVSGTYGDFTTDSRDLQEVIRNFVKFAHSNWGISWLLLGGDLDVIPVRRVVGASEGHINIGTNDPPDENQSYWTGSFLKMHVNKPGTWFPGNVNGLTLVRADLGTLIPFDAAGTSSPTTAGWFFTTDDTYSTRSTTPTRYIRVNGPATQVNGRMQWIYQWNSIPTDLYYASLTGPNYNVPDRHDWDMLDNEIYGQHTNNVDMDGVAYQTDISVGRVPVSTATQAEAFINKIIAYESCQNTDGNLLDMTWTRKLLLISSNWGGRLHISATAISPPTDNRYHHSSGANHTLIKLKKAFEHLDRRLLVQVTETDIRLIPYDRDSATSGRGWYYAISDTNLAPSEITINIFGMTFHCPIPTKWVVVYGQSDELEPHRYIFDHTNPDGSLKDQEALRQQIETELPWLNDIHRLYEDEIDLTPAEMAATPINHLTADRVQDQINAGKHFVSLSGHGNSGGCCGLSIGTAQSATNILNNFIGYADSCLTNQFDAEDAVSEHLLYNPNGGAIAYIGNTRFSWIGVGDNFQRAFFNRLTSTTHIGLLNDTRCLMVNEWTGFYRLYNKWAIFALNLMGDPEMPIWKGTPRTMKVSFPKKLDKRHPFEVVVKRWESWLGIEFPLSDAVVTIRQDAFLRQARTGAAGRVFFDIRPTHLGDLEITVTKLGFRPFMDTAEVVGPAWVRGLVKLIAHQHSLPNATYVQLELDPRIEGMTQRGWYARDTLRDYRIILDAVTDAYITEKKINLLVQSIKEGGTIERFRFGAWQEVLRIFPDLSRLKKQMMELANIPTVSQADFSEIMISAISHGAETSEADDFTDQSISETATMSQDAMAEEKSEKISQEEDLEE